MGPIRELDLYSMGYIHQRYPILSSHEANYIGKYVSVANDLTVELQ